MDGTIEGTEIQVSGTKPSSGNLTYEDNVLKEGCLVFDEYKVIFEDGKVKETSKGNCENLSPTSCFIEKENYYSDTTWFEYDENNPGTIIGFSDKWEELEESNPRKRNIVIPCTRIVDGEEIPITDINNFAFQNEILDNLIITDNIINTNYGAFTGITVNKVIFGKSIDLITNGTFESSKKNGIKEPSKIGTIIFTNGPTKIDNSAFESVHINTIVFEKDVGSIGDWGTTFQSSVIDNIIFLGNVRKISWNSFAVAQINNMIFKKNIQELTYGAFGSSQIKNIVFGEQQGIIDNGETIVFGEGIETINNSAFVNTPYKKVVLPNGLKIFGYSAFQGEALEEIYFPNSTEDINLAPIEHYPNLKTIHYSGNKTFDWATILGGTKKSDDGNGTIVIERTGYTDVTITKD